MPRSRARRCSTDGNLQVTATRARRTRAKVRQLADLAAPKQKPVRGVKLKTVSLWTMLFALACLGAFIAGRPPASAAGLVPSGGVQRQFARGERECLRNAAARLQAHRPAAHEASVLTAQ